MAAATLAPLVACEAVPGCPDVAATFALTMPGGATELVPGQSVRFTWTPIAADSAVVAFVLVEGDARIPVGTVATNLGMHDVAVDDNGMPIPPGVYRIQGVFGGCALGDAPYDAGPSRLVYAQGVTFADTTLAISAADTPRDIAFTTVSLSSFELELLVDPTPATAGDELVFATGTVPGELVAMTRRYAFTGMTTTGAAIPGGSYRVLARVHARTDTIVYVVTGPQLTWTP